MEKIDTVIIGAGHAGLSISNILTARGVEHAVLDRTGVAARWSAERWDSFSLLTPNWATWLPNWHYDGTEPHGFMGREEVVSYLTRYARAFNAPIREGVDVSSLGISPAGGYRLISTAGEIHAGKVVIATGPFQRPRLPAWSIELPHTLTQLHSSGYRNAAQLPDGAVLVVGSGPSGQQIAEDLVNAGRTVYLSVGRHNRVPRRYRGRDFYWWQELGGFYDKTSASTPIAVQRQGAAPALTGVDGGHDLDLRQLHSRGVTLLGRAVGMHGTRLQCGTHLQDDLAAGDLALDRFRDWVEARLHRFEGLYGEPEPHVTYPDPPTPPNELDLLAAGVSTVIWATGFQQSFSEWVRVPVFDAKGFPQHQRGETDFPGLYFLGLPWLHRQRSPFIRGAEEDAQHVASLILNPPHN
ncbi:MAG: putative monooxygenase [Homoserinimonas sp.]|jgi:putative flavoprotein involved in K+ transport|nr:putative monooxygenase [Homoserinimonas sp.]